MRATIGLSPEKQKKLFLSFSQADNSTTRKYGGTGLGLFISKQLVEMMDGDIWVKSELGVGSTFNFTVRLEKQQNVLSQPPLSETQNETNAIAQLRNSKILLVEDNEINQELVMELLTMNGIKVKIVNNGQEALDILAKEKFDGILMDCQMPIMDGYETTSHLRKQEKLKNLPVIALTSNAMKGDKEKVLSVGMNDHIAKPIKPDAMFITMAKWINT